MSHVKFRFRRRLNCHGNLRKNFLSTVVQLTECGELKLRSRFIGNSKQLKITKMFYVLFCTIIDPPSGNIATSKLAIPNLNEAKKNKRALMVCRVPLSDASGELYEVMGRWFLSKQNDRWATGAYRCWWVFSTRQLDWNCKLALFIVSSLLSSSLI